MSNPINDGGPAFPHSSQPLDAQGNPIACNHTEWGMSIRDWFAGQEDVDVSPIPQEVREALAGTPPQGTRHSNPLEWFAWENKWRAAVRYARADAMLAARKGGAE